MEINKLTFEQMNLNEITQSFDDLDVNGDGVINQQDKTIAKNNKIKTAIEKALNAADDDVELVNATKTGATKDKYGINTTDAANFDNDIKNSKGTTYVVMGNLNGCGFCINLANAMSKQLNELEGVANIYNMDWNDNNNLCWDIVKQGGITGSVGFPQIAKFVDGKFVGLVDNPRSPQKAIQNMLNGAEGTPDAGGTEKAEGTGEAEKAANGLTAAEQAEWQGKLDKINEEIAALEAQLKTLQEENAELEKQRAELVKEQETAEAEAEEEQKRLEEEQATLEAYTKEYDDYQEKIEAFNKEILKEQDKEEEDFKEEMNVAVNNAINNYNPETDGDDFEAYFAQKMDGIGFPTFTKLNSLNWEATSLQSEAQTCLKNIFSQAAVVQAQKTIVSTKLAAVESIKAQITALDTQITANTTEITKLQGDLDAKNVEKKEIQKKLGVGELSAAEVLALIPSEEICLAKENNVDITKCVVAQASDGKYHIYEPGDNWAQQGTDGYYMSVARKYGSGEGWNKGTDMAAWGSGEMSLSTSARYHQYADEAGHGDFSQAIYKFTCINDDWTDGECTSECQCYDTDSPLSFDVNGDGIKTTDETVSFDIDGDGTLDTVNNSNDWVLAFDKDKDGIAGENGSELFGNNTDIDGDGKADGYKDGFEALKALAKKEGLIGENDTVLDAADIEKLSKKYGLTMTQGYGGETKSLSELGITEINLSQTDETTLSKNFDGKNNDIMTQEGATFVVNGETHEYADIWNAKKDANEAVTKDSKAIANSDTKSAFTNLKDVTLELNQHGVITIKGDADFKGVKNKAMKDVTPPSEEIFEKLIEIEEEIE